MDRQDIEAFRRAEIDKTLAEMNLDRREHPRVCSSMSEPIIFIHDGEEFLTHNISLGGMALVAKQSWQPGALLKGKIFFKNTQHALDVTLLTKDRSDNNLTNCQLIEMDQSGLDMVKLYIRKRQEEIARFFLTDLDPSSQ
jgi:hypothetical protein